MSQLGTLESTNLSRGCKRKQVDDDIKEELTDEDRTLKSRRKCPRSTTENICLWNAALVNFSHQNGTFFLQLYKKVEKDLICFSFCVSFSQVPALWVMHVEVILLDTNDQLWHTVTTTHECTNTDTLQHFSAEVLSNCSLCNYKGESDLKKFRQHVHTAWTYVANQSEIRKEFEKLGYYIKPKKFNYQGEHCWTGTIHQQYYDMFFFGNLQCQSGSMFLLEHKKELQVSQNQNEIILRLIVQFICYFMKSVKSKRAKQNSDDANSCPEYYQGESDLKKFRQHVHTAWIYVVNQSETRKEFEKLGYYIKPKKFNYQGEHCWTGTIHQRYYDMFFFGNLQCQSGSMLLLEHNKGQHISQLQNEVILRLIVQFICYFTKSVKSKGAKQNSDDTNSCPDILQIIDILLVIGKVRDATIPKFAENDVRVFQKCGVKAKKYPNIDTNNQYAWVAIVDSDKNFVFFDCTGLPKNGEGDRYKKHTEVLLCSKIDNFFKERHCADNADKKELKLYMFTLNSPCIVNKSDCISCMDMLMEKCKEWVLEKQVIRCYIGFHKFWGLEGDVTRHKGEYLWKSCIDYVQNKSSCQHEYLEHMTETQISLMQKVIEKEYTSIQHPFKQKKKRKDLTNNIYEMTKKHRPVKEPSEEKENISQQIKQQRKTYSEVVKDLKHKVDSLCNKPCDFQTFIQEGQHMTPSLPEPLRSGFKNKWQFMMETELQKTVDEFYLMSFNQMYNEHVVAAFLDIQKPYYEEYMQFGWLL